MRVLGDEAAAAAGADDDRFGTGIEPGAEPVDRAPRGIEPGGLRVQVIFERATATDADALRAEAERIEHARRGRVDVRRQRRLHAALGDQHAARMTRGRPRRRGPRQRHLRSEGLRQQRPEPAAESEQRGEAPRLRQHEAQQGAAQALPARARHALLDDLAADVDEPPVLHAARAGRLAGAAAQAAVEMRLRLGRDRLAFEHFLDLVDAAARAVELVAEQLVSRTGRVAETAVHAGAQDAVGLPALRRVADVGGEIGLHGGRWLRTRRAGGAD
ncbi:MAG: hypothetical protein NVS9B10_22920 [Nevskia sp.]